LSKQRKVKEPRSANTRKSENTRGGGCGGSDLQIVPGTGQGDLMGGKINKVCKKGSSFQVRRWSFCWTKERVYKTKDAGGKKRQAAPVQTKKNLFFGVLMKNASLKLLDRLAT